MLMSVIKLLIKVPEINPKIKNFFLVVNENSIIKRIVWAILRVSEKSLKNDLLKSVKTSMKKKKPEMALKNL
jgi:hypothetical protein